MDFYNEFIGIVKHLNKELDIVPVLYGSLGLQIVSGMDFNPQDIDLLVPKTYIGEKWDLLRIAVEEIGFVLLDLNEHEFIRDGLKLAFSFEEDLLPFAGVDYNNLCIKDTQGVKFKSLSIEEYLKVYSKSVTDGYRRTKNNNKDNDKIKKLKEILSINQ